MKIMRRGKVIYSFFIGIYIRSADQPVPCYDLLFLRIPGDQLVICVLAGVVFINIHGQPCASAGRPEGKLPQPPDFLNGVGLPVMINQVNFDIPEIGIS
ncbi:hypothetical protein FQZ97_850810 [compost metagenome]